MDCLAVEFRTIDYTNNPMVIAQHHNVVAINGALGVDSTGQATAELMGKAFYSGIGGQVDFMRGAVLSSGGKPILALQSTASNGTVSRIVPFLKEGAGVTLNRGDIHHVVTEYGTVYLHGKNIRERAMSLSDSSLYQCFLSARKDMPHERLQEFVVVDYAKQMSLLAVLSEDGKKETVIGLGQYLIYDDSYTAQVAFVVRDDYENEVWVVSW